MNIILDMILLSFLDNHINRPFSAAQIRKLPRSELLALSTSLT